MFALVDCTFLLKLLLSVFAGICGTMCFLLVRWRFNIRRINMRGCSELTSTEYKRTSDVLDVKLVEGLRHADVALGRPEARAQSRHGSWWGMEADGGIVAPGQVKWEAEARRLAELSAAERAAEERARAAQLESICAAMRARPEHFGTEIAPADVVRQLTAFYSTAAPKYVS